jgi:chromosome segregation ATPase
LTATKEERIAQLQALLETRESSGSEQIQILAKQIAASDDKLAEKDAELLHANTLLSAAEEDRARNVSLYTQQQETFNQERAQLSDKCTFLEGELSRIRAEVDLRKGYVPLESLKEADARSTEALQTQEARHNQAMDQLQSQVRALEIALQEAQEKNKSLEAQAAERPNQSDIEQRLRIALTQLEQFRQMVQTMRSKADEVVGLQQIIDQNKQLLATERASKIEAENVIASLRSQNRVLMLSGVTTGVAVAVDTRLPLLMLEVGSFTCRVYSWKSDVNGFEIL